MSVCVCVKKLFQTLFYNKINSLHVSIYGYALAYLISNMISWELIFGSVAYLSVYIQWWTFFGVQLF